jgi:uncharacterized protein (TIGR02270 family)
MAAVLAFQRRSERWSPPVSWSLVEESLDEAEFLWSWREAALDAHDETPDGVEQRIEDRLQGAIEGLCVPGPSEIDRLLRLLAPALDRGEPAIVAVAAHALLAGGSGEGFDCVAAAFWAASGVRLESLRRGLELIPAAAPYLGLIAPSRHAPDGARAAFLEASAFRGLPIEPHVGELVASANAELQRAASRLLRHAPRTVADEPLTRAFGCTDGRAREIAVESGLILGLPEAWRIGRALALADVNGSGALLPALAMLGTAADHDGVLRMLGRPARQRDAIWALGFGGRRSGADACLDLLAQQQHAGLATEAFCAITGLDLARAGLIAARAAAEDEDDGAGDETPPFEDDDLDAALVPRAEDRLPEPDVSGMIRWWNGNRARFDPSVRYLGGQPTSLPRLAAALAGGPMRRRAPIAFELAVRTRGRLQIQTRAFLGEQRRRLAASGGTSGAMSGAMSGGPCCS